MGEIYQGGDAAEFGGRAHDLPASAELPEVTIGCEGDTPAEAGVDFDTAVIGVGEVTAEADDVPAVADETGGEVEDITETAGEADQPEPDADLVDMSEAALDALRAELTARLEELRTAAADLAAENEAHQARIAEAAAAQGDTPAAEQLTPDEVVGNAMAGFDDEWARLLGGQ